MAQIPSRLKKILREQYNFLKKSCEEYDRGDKSEAKRIAVVLRVLVHEASRSKSLISQLEDIGYQPVKILSRNQGFSPGLLFYVGATVQAQNGNVSFEPMLDLTHPALKPIPISDWWNQGTLLINGIPFTRKDITLSLVNKEGGAHVDQVQDENFRRLTEGDLAILQNHKGKVVGDIELVMMRENGYFMMKCLENSFADLLS